MKCVNCNEEIIDDNKTCPNCRKEITKKENTLKKFIICLIGAILVAGIVLWIYFYLTKSPFIGTWVREIEEDGTITDIKLEIKRNKTFIYQQGIKNDSSHNILSGKYTIKNNQLTMHYKLNNRDVEYNIYLLDKEKICLGKENCEEYSKLINVLSPKNKKYVIEKVEEPKNPIIEINYNQYKDIIKNSEYTIILLASEECSHCQQYKPLIKQVAEEYNLTIYYLDVSKSLNNQEYNMIHDSYTALKDMYYEQVPIIPTPTTIITKDGQEIDSKIGNIGYNGFKDMLQKNYVIR